MYSRISSTAPLKFSSAEDFIRHVVLTDFGFVGLSDNLGFSLEDSETIHGAPTLENIRAAVVRLGRRWLSPTEALRVDSVWRLKRIEEFTNAE